MSMTLPNTRGIRNLNPGNIRLGSKWIGLSPKQNDSSFCQFTSMYYGVRACAIIVTQTYRKRGLVTINDIISAYAPPSDKNPTNSYISHCSALVQRSPSEVLEKPSCRNGRKLYAALLAAIFTFENGDVDDFYYWSYFSESVILDLTNL